MRLSWGQGKIEVQKRQQEILDFLAADWTPHQIFLHFKADGLQAGRTTFYRAIKHLKAEQQAVALPVPVSKARPPKVSDQRSSSTHPPSADVVQVVSEEEEPSSRSSLMTANFQRPDLDTDQDQFWGK